MAHAYIFEGENKTAVREQALAFAKGLNCAHSAPQIPETHDQTNPSSLSRTPFHARQNLTACGTCHSCRIFDSGNHPDTIYVHGTKQSSIGVDDVREQIVVPAAIKPFKYEYKIFITENADTLTPQAQNALLKTIEEPAPYGVFLFLAPNTFNFLPTILSRCVVKKVRSASGDVSPEIKALAEEIFATLAGADIPQAFALYRKIEPLPKDEVQEFLNALYILCGQKRHLLAATQITKTKQALSQNANAQLAIELLFLKMRGAA